MPSSLCMRLFLYSRMPRSRSSRRQNGGGVGASFGFTPSPVGQLINNDLSWKSVSSCGTTTERPGFLSGVVPTGLPGMSLKGGRRKGKGRKSRKVGKSRKSRKVGKSRKSRKVRKGRKTQRGGRYGFTGPDSLVNGTPSGATYGPVTRLDCDASRSAIPSGGSSLNVRGGELWTGQGGGEMSPAQFGGEPSMTVPTARYTQLDGVGGSFATAAGTRVMVNAPLGGAEMNPACLKTGGSRLLSRNIRNKIRKERKNAKASPVKKSNLKLNSNSKLKSKPNNKAVVNQQSYNP